ncbi:MAG: helix-turn-helix domain-containing protein [Gammaproteobacteria bacterium]|nr:helix-turn-helix domain-containing protein [Gammaproteobacteria bacterium]
MEIIMVEVVGKFSPKWVSPPGDTILDLLEERGWPQSEFAERAAYTPKHVSLLVNGKAPITEDTAFRLERVLGGSARFWLSREANYREAIAREDEQASLRGQEKWLREVPLAHMIKCKWVDKTSDKASQVAECLSFFGVASVDAWRRKYEEPVALAAFKSSSKYEKKIAATGA